jgi:mannose-6-phosphate isomerase
MPIVDAEGRSAQVLRLDNPLRPYAWGSPDFIPALLGNEANGEPVAEMWMGAHPAAPSALAATGLSLADFIADDPETVLSSEVSARFGDRLPFLLKVLAADKPLSIQAHPNVDEARAGFAAENARGVPIGAPGRNYADANHKPELICALTDFDALIGFRNVADTVGFLQALAERGARQLGPISERLPADGGLRDVVTEILGMSAVRRAELLAELVPACSAIATQNGKWQHECQWICRLAEFYPGDAGVILALLMNLVRLRPGQAFFLSAGRIHSYLRGAGVELMASSDNVLRCGLTSKHVDVAELLEVLDFTTEAPVPLEPVRDGGLLHYPVTVPDFLLSRVDLDGTASASWSAMGPQIVLCTNGRLELAVNSEDQCSLISGQAVFIPAGVDLSLRGDGQLFRATTNLLT